MLSVNSLVLSCWQYLHDFLQPTSLRYLNNSKISNLKNINKKGCLNFTFHDTQTTFYVFSAYTA